MKIFLEKGESQEETEDLLFKALKAQRTGGTHNEQFPDPVMEHLASDLKADYRKRMADMMAEIEALLEQA